MIELVHVQRQFQAMKARILEQLADVIDSGAYILGPNVERFEAEAAATAETGLDSEEWLERSMPALQALVASGRFPMMSRMLAEDYDLDLDLLARSGITYLLDGLAVRLQRARR